MWVVGWAPVRSTIGLTGLLLLGDGVGDGKGECGKDRFGDW